MKVESISNERDLDKFSQVLHKGIGTVHLKKGEQNHIRITADIEILDSVKAEVYGDTLEVKMQDPVEVGLKSLLKLKKPDYTVEITYTELQSISQRGVGNMVHEGVLEAQKFSIENRGVGDVNLHIHAQELQTKLMGVGNIALQGEVENHDVEIKGTGSLYAQDLETKSTRIVNSGVGTSRINASEELYAELNGVGKISYRGNPRVQSKLNGLGSIVSE